jgi:hypothetical protein
MTDFTSAILVKSCIVFRADLIGVIENENDLSTGSSDYCNFCMQKAYDQFKNTSELELFKGFLKKYYSDFVLVKISDKILTSFFTPQL